MRARADLAFAITAAILLLGTQLSAHRADEYLQAARIAIAQDRVDVELDLTPGIALADGIAADIDRDHDGRLTAAEKDAYVTRVLGAVSLAVDDRPLSLRTVSSTFPDLGALASGEATIRLQLSAQLKVAGGSHRLLFRNEHERRIGAYLANALIPESDLLRITGQQREVDQSRLTIEYVLPSDKALSLPAGLLWSLAAVAALRVLLTRPGTRLQRPARSFASTR